MKFYPTERPTRKRKAGENEMFLRELISQGDDCYCLEWQTNYANVESARNSLDYQIKKHNLPLKILTRGDVLYIERV